MVQAYTLGSPYEAPHMDIADRNLARLLKEYRSAAMSWSKPTLRIYKVEYEKRPDGLITSFRGEVIGTFWGEWGDTPRTDKCYYKTGTKVYSVSKEGKLTEIKMK